MLLTGGVSDSACDTVVRDVYWSTDRRRLALCPNDGRISSRHLRDGRTLRGDSHYYWTNDKNLRFPYGVRATIVVMSTLDTGPKTRAGHDLRRTRARHLTHTVVAGGRRWELYVRSHATNGRRTTIINRDNILAESSATKRRTGESRSTGTYGAVETTSRHTKTTHACERPSDTTINCYYHDLLAYTAIAVRWRRRSEVESAGVVVVVFVVVGGGGRCLVIVDSDANSAAAAAAVSH